MRRLGYAALIGLVLTPASSFAETKFKNDKAITADRLKYHLEFVASDEMEGRDTPSRGLDTATLYVATQLKLWGAQPAGDDGTFFQKIALVQRSLDTTTSLIELGGKTFTFGEGFKSASRGVEGTGKLVYAGHGYMVKKLNIDPYAGLDVKGKILVVASGLPKGASFRDLQGTVGTDYMTPVSAAQKLGAIGVVTIPTPDYLSRWSPERSTRMGGRQIEAPGTQPVAGNSNITAGADLAKAIFDREQISADDAMKGSEAPEKGVSLNDTKSMRLNIVEAKDIQYTRNVVAIVPGTDKELKNEYVAFGAHIDHVGMRQTGTGDRIFNGADDDGSGTVAILEIAHAFLTGPRPKRSCLFVWHCGEEKGLWGSAFFTDHPTVDLKNVITQLNIDMIGRSKPAGDTKPANRMLTPQDEIYVVGSTKMSTDLKKVSESVNASYLKIKFNYHYDEPNDPESIFFRSDHYNYARKGVPIIFYYDGEHEDYHRVGDEVSKIDFTKMANVTRTVYATGFTLADNKKRPVVDKPLK